MTRNINIEEYIEFKPEYIYIIKPINMVNEERAVGNTYTILASVKTSFGEPLSQVAPDRTTYVCISISNINQGVDTPCVIDTVINIVINNTPNFSMLFSPISINSHFSMTSIVNKTVINSKITILAHKLMTTRVGITDKISKDNTKQVDK